MSENINTGAILEALNDKTDRDCRNVDTTVGADAVIAYQVPTSANNYTWYRLYKSGWVEQGGYFPNPYTGNNSGTSSISLSKTMADTNYYISRTPRWTDSDSSDNHWYLGYQSKTTSSFTVKMYGQSYLTGFEWEVKGFAAQS